MTSHLIHPHARQQKPIGEEKRYGQGELAMKCPNCGDENPEGKKFCGDCGAVVPQPPPPPVQPMQPVYAQPKQSWIRSNWKGLVSVVIVVLVVLSVVGLIYDQPWSKVKVLLYNQDHTYTLNVAIFVDGKEVMRGRVLPSQGGIMGVYTVKQGSHLISVDGFWSYGSYAYGSFDNIYDWSNTYAVGPLYTKNVFIYLGPRT
jgi:hypothetical protein